MKKIVFGNNYKMNIDKLINDNEENKMKIEMLNNKLKSIEALNLMGNFMNLLKLKLTIKK